MNLSIHIRMYAKADVPSVKGQTLQEHFADKDAAVPQPVHVARDGEPCRTDRGRGRVKGQSSKTKQHCFMNYANTLYKPSGWIKTPAVGCIRD